MSDCPVKMREDSVGPVACWLDGGTWGLWGEPPTSDPLVALVWALARFTHRSAAPRDPVALGAAGPPAAAGAMGIGWEVPHFCLVLLHMYM